MCVHVLAELASGEFSTVFDLGHGCGHAGTALSVSLGTESLDGGKESGGRQSGVTSADGESSSRSILLPAHLHSFGFKMYFYHILANGMSTCLNKVLPCRKW